MANEIPDSSTLSGLSRSVIAYSERFKALTEKLRAPGFSEADWAPIEELVDTKKFVRLGVFTGAESEVIDWAKYRYYVTQFAGSTHWEGTLRRITETPGLVYLELEERNTREGVTDVSNTVTIYKFNDAGKLINLDVYVSPLGKRPAAK